MYHNGYVESLPVQLPEIQNLVKDYFANHYNHNFICRHKKELVIDFIEKFVPWLNTGHLKFKGLKDFKNVYITNGVTEFIQTAMVEHSIKPVLVENEYKAYWAHAKTYIRAGVKLNNKVDVITNDGHDTQQFHPTYGITS